MSGLGRALAAIAQRPQSWEDDDSDFSGDFTDDLLTEDSALEQARDEWLGTAGAVADTLAKVCDTEAGWQPVDVFALTGSGDATDAVALDTLATHQLLSIVMLGTDAQALPALHALRERMALELRDDIRIRADELLDAQERLQRNARDEWEMERAA